MAKANRTQEAKLVRFVGSIDPVPGHRLVVFKKVGAGRVFRTTLQPGERLKRSLLESSTSFIAYAVTDDQNLRHRFNRQYDSHDQIHSVDLHFTLEYWISEPRVLVEELEHDPLQRLEEEIHAAVLQAMKRVDWSSVALEPVDLEQILFPDPMEEASERERLHRFAASQGCEIRRMRVVRKLPPGELKVSAARRQHEERRELLHLEHGTKSLGLENHSALKAQAQSSDLQLAGEQGAFDRRKKVADGMADVAVRALNQATDGIRSFGDIRGALGEIAAFQPMVLGLAGGPAAAGAMPALPGAPGVALLGSSSAAASPLATILAELPLRLGGLACEPVLQRQILSLALHVVAEALRGEDADPETLDRCGKGLQGLSTALLSMLSREQVQLLVRLRDVETLKRQLS
jgi:hypothetical protein